MVEYSCLICDFKTKIKTHYKRHCETNKHKKNEIEATKNLHQFTSNYINLHQFTSIQNPDNNNISNNFINELNNNKIKCEFCNFDIIKNNMSRHQRTTCKKIPNYKRKELVDKYNNHKSSKKQLVINNNNTSINNTNSHNTTNIQNNNIQNNNIQNNITVKINPLGQEDISFLTEEDKLNILAKRFIGVPELIKLIHNNQNNKIYYMPNVNKRIIAYLNKDNELEYDDYDIIIRKLIDDNKDRFDEFFYELRDKINSKIIDKVSDVVLEHDNNENINDKYSKDIKYNIMSKSREIKETIDNYLKELKELVRVNIEER